MCEKLWELAVIYLIIIEPKNAKFVHSFMGGMNGQRFYEMWSKSFAGSRQMWLENCRNRSRFKLTGALLFTDWYYFVHHVFLCVLWFGLYVRESSLPTHAYTHTDTLTHTSANPIIRLVHWFGCSIWYGCISKKFCFWFSVLAFSQHSEST